MAESDKEKESLTSKLLLAILVPVAIALIVGGTSPWWWSEIFASERPAPQPAPQPASLPSPQPTSEPNPGAEAVDREAKQQAEAEQRLEERLNYREVELRQLARRGFPLQGTDPREITFNMLGRATLGEGERPSVLERQSFTEYSIVTITNEGMADDSVSAQRYRLEFEPIDDQRWQIVWAGTQQRCWRGDNPEEWVTQLCP
jgi:hypothetical protein